MGPKTFRKLMSEVRNLVTPLVRIYLVRKAVNIFFRLTFRVSKIVFGVPYGLWVQLMVILNRPFHIF